MKEHEASRTLVKSPPELWSECSDPTSLARHLGDWFGEIRITRLEPETAVAWEGEHASGTVRLEPSGWGTKVILTLRAQDEALGPPEPVPEPEPEADPEPEAAPEPARQPEPEAALEPVRQPEPEAALEPNAIAEPEVVAEPEPEPEGIPGPAPEVVALADPPTQPAPAKRGFFKRIRAMFGAEPAQENPILLTPVVQDEPDRVEPEAAPPVEPEAAPPAEPDPMAVQPDPEPAPRAVPEPDEIAAADTRATTRRDAGAALTAALDSLGQAHHRPFSRA